MISLTSAQQCTDDATVGFLSTGVMVEDAEEDEGVDVYADVCVGGADGEGWG